MKGKKAIVFWVNLVVLVGIYLLTLFVAAEMLASVGTIIIAGPADRFFQFIMHIRINPKRFIRAMQRQVRRPLSKLLICGGMVPESSDTVFPNRSIASFDTLLRIKDIDRFNRPRRIRCYGEGKHPFLDVQPLLSFGGLR